MTVLAVLLAAGAGARFRASGGTGSKLLAPLGARPVVEHALSAMVAGGADEAAVVVADGTLRAHLPGTVTILTNPRPEDGLASSLRVAIDHARARGHDAVVVGLADQPGVAASAWRAVVGAPDTPPIAVATYDGVRGHPVRLGVSVWDLVPVSGDRGAGTLLGERPELVREVPCTGNPADIDVVEDLEQWS